MIRISELNIEIIVNITKFHLISTCFNFQDSTRKTMSSEYLSNLFKEIEIRSDWNP